MLDSIASSPVLKTIKYLLEAGANPNLNELLIKGERSKVNDLPQVMYGRNLFPSALAAFYDSFNKRNWSGFGSGDSLGAPIRKYVFPWIFAVTELLVRAGAKVENYAKEDHDGKEESQGEDADSGLLNFSFVKEDSEELHTFNVFLRDVLINAISDDYIDSGTFIAETLLLLLRSGVDLNRAKHAHWLDRFCRQAVHRLSWAIHRRHFYDSEEDLDQAFLDGIVGAEVDNADFYHCVVIILDHVTRGKAKRIVDEMDAPLPGEAQNSKVAMIRKALVRLIAGPVNEVRSLIHLSASASWAVAERSEGRLLEMNLPAGLSSVICRSFDPSFYGLNVEGYGCGCHSAEYALVITY